jgi:hypothetical protein
MAEQQLGKKTFHGRTACEPVDLGNFWKNSVLRERNCLQTLEDLGINFLEQLKQQCHFLNVF